MSRQLDVFSLPLAGRQLIEASAGTGKTFNITRLYLRLLLERELNVDQILVMTFTRAATEELQARIGLVLRTALQQLEAPVGDDELLRALRPRIDVARARLQLQKALLMLDEAAIFTLHGFCHRVLEQQAFSSGLPFHVTLTPTTNELLLEAIRDIYRRNAHDPQVLPLLQGRWPTPELFYQSFASAITSTLPIDVQDPEQLCTDYYAMKKAAIESLSQAKETLYTYLIQGHKDQQKRERELIELEQWLTQKDLSAMPKAAANVFHGGRFGRGDKKATLQQLTAPLNALKAKAKDINEQYERARPYPLLKTLFSEIQTNLTQQKRQQQLLTFDDLVSHLAHTVSDEGSGQILRSSLQQQYPVALVDEFQDTDSDQYRILDALYGDADNTNDRALFMIGDPKQAIYGFRGGDVFAYLAAREQASELWWMDTNWRSSQAMITAYNRLFWGEPLSTSARNVFQYGIDYQPVKAGNGAQQLHDPFTHQALQFISLTEPEATASNSNALQQTMAQWCAAEIQRLLSGTVTLSQQPLQPTDIAILVRDGHEAELMRQALRQQQLSAVYLSQHDNLFASPEAKWLEIALAGILYPEQERRFKAALTTPLFGFSSHRLFQLDHDTALWQTTYEHLDRLRSLWQQRGIMAMALQLFQYGVHPRPEQHQRTLTNFLHLFELLQQQSRRYRQPIHLLHWLEEQQRLTFSAEEAELRLESDDELIRIVTQHGAKGLEYPIIFVPFASRYKAPLKRGSMTVDHYRYHDDQYRARLQLGLVPETAHRAEQETDAEAIRLLYVAITRAKQRCYLGVPPLKQADRSPLARLLGVNEQQSFATIMQQLATELPENITTREQWPDITPGQQSLPAQEDEARAAVFSGHIERDWWLSSFSALTRNLRQGGVSRPDRDDDGTLLENSDGEQLRFALPHGTAAGNLLHDILEHTDFTAPNWPEHCYRPLARFGALPEGYQEQELYQWLTECLQTPLIENVTLQQLSTKMTLREAEFYFPMHDAKMPQLSALLAKHRQQTLALSLPNRSRLKGMMHGFIDLIFEIDGRFYLADYKSTYLGAQYQHYTAAALADNIRNNLYDIQYLIYALALHRYLRQRLPDYVPEHHFGGVFYLYLRGMHPQHHTGVYHHPLSADLLEQLDQLFAGEVR